MGLGSLRNGTRPITLAGARKKAEEIRGILAQGGDPFKDMAERQGRTAAMKFVDVVKSFLATKDGTWRNTKHEAQWKMTLGEAYCARLLRLPVDEIDTNDVVAVLEPHWREKHETASRLRGRIENVLDYAKTRGLRDGENPARWKGHIEHLLPKPSAELRMKRGHHAALPFADIPAFMPAVRARSTTSSKALEFLILTAARTGEVLGAAWEEIDLTSKVWSIPARRMKAGREHRVPLTARALEILEGINGRTGLVFQGAKAGAQLSNTSLAKALVSAGGSNATLHGFRSTFRDWVSDRTNFPSELAEAALAHLVGDEVERAYRRGDALEKRRNLMAAWESYLSDTSVGNVVSLSKAVVN